MDGIIIEGTMLSPEGVALSWTTLSAIAPMSDRLGTRSGSYLNPNATTGRARSELNFRKACLWTPHVRGRDVYTRPVCGVQNTRTRASDTLIDLRMRHRCRDRAAQFDATPRWAAALM